MQTTSWPNGQKKEHFWAIEADHVRVPLKRNMNLRRGLLLLTALAVAAGSDELVDSLKSDVADLKQQVALLMVKVASQERLQEIPPTQSNSAQPPGRRLTGSSSNQASFTYDGTNVIIDSAVKINGSLTVTGQRSSLGVCFKRWGVWGCPSVGGFAPVVNGYAGNIESYSDQGIGEYQVVNDDCISADAPIINSWSSDYYQRLAQTPVADNGNGVVFVSGKCTTCCNGGCYTRYGGTDCHSGYTAVYTGRAGGIEHYKKDSGQRGSAKLMCVDSTSTVTDSTSEGNTAVETRLFRYTDSGVGMDTVSAECAM